MPSISTVIAQDVCGERHALPGLGDRCQHRRIGLVAVAQQGQGVARLRRTLRDAPRRDLQRCQVVVDVHARRRGAPPAVAPHRAQPPCAAPDAVDAEHEIEEPAEDRRQPRQADPADGSPDVALALQHVHGHRHGDHKADQRHHIAAHLAQQPFDFRQDHAVQPRQFGSVSSDQWCRISIGGMLDSGGRDA
jgi:hypothetical protein